MAGSILPDAKLLARLSKLSPDELVTPSDKLQKELLTTLQILFGCRARGLAMQDRKDLVGFEELFVDGFDSEQLWAMLNAENQPLVENLEERISSLIENQENVTLLEEDDDDGDDEAEVDAKFGSDDEDEEEERKTDTSDAENEEFKEDFSTSPSSDEEEEEEGAQDSSNGDQDAPPTEMDDEFFKYSDMEKFTEEVEEEDIAMKAMLNDMEAGKLGEPNEDDYSDEEAEGNEYEDDYDDDDNDDGPGNEGASYMFADLWGQQGNRASRNQHSNVLSSHERRQLEIKKQIEELEYEAMSDKPWAMSGESRATTRPKNSLLEKGDLDVDYLVKSAPVINEETTQSLEDRIKQRILDNDFDDVERRLPMAKDAQLKQAAVLSMEKSKSGLAEEYEKDYRENVMGQTPEEETKLEEEHREIQDLFSKLCYKLDALSNYHFTPKPPSLDGAIKPMNVAAIQMEETLPVAMSSASQAAPEQVLAVKKGKDGLLKSVEEMDQSERKRLRQDRKRAKRARKRQREAQDKIVSKLQPGLGNKHSKEAVVKRTSKEKGLDWTKSQTFFDQLAQNQENGSKKTKRSPLLDTEKKVKAASLRL